MLLALSVAALFAVATDSTRIQHAATIHSDSADYLQLDFAPLPGCGRPVVDSLVLQGRAKVVWHMDTTLDSGCAATTRANLLVAFPSTVGGTHGAVDIDTVYDARRDSSLFPVPKVHYPKVTACLYDCYAPLDSATAFQTVAAKVAGASYVAFFSSFYEESYAAISPWSLSSSTDSEPIVVVPMPGNAGNWITRGIAAFQADSVVSGADKCRLTGSICLPKYVGVATGEVRYQYQLQADPFYKGVVNGGMNSFVRDTVLKLGPSLHLSGYIQYSCGSGFYDSALVQESRWLVAASDTSGDSITAAFHRSAICGARRPGAWPVRGDSVEISTDVWVPFADLLAAAKASSNKPAVSAAKGLSLRRVGSSVRLSLPSAASVRVVDLRGSEVMASRRYEAGTRELSLSRATSMLFVQVRSGTSTTTLPLEPVR